MATFGMDYWYRGAPVSSARTSASTDFGRAYRGDLKLPVGKATATTTTVVSTDSLTFADGSTLAASVGGLDPFAGLDAASILASSTGLDGAGFQDGNALAASAGSGDSGGFVDASALALLVASLDSFSFADAGFQSIAVSSVAIVSADSFSFTDGLTTRRAPSSAFDDFTGTSGQALDVRTATPSGGTWTAHSSRSLSNIQVDSAGKARGARASYASIYMPSVAPSGADQSVSWTYTEGVNTTAGTKSHGAGLRVSSVTDSGYYGLLYNNRSTFTTEWRIVKRSGGTETVLASASATVVAGTDYAMSFSVAGSTLALSVDGSTVATASDSTFTSAGFYAIYMSPMQTTTANDGRIDDFTLSASAVAFVDSITPEVVQPLSSDPFAVAEALKLSASLRSTETVSASETTALDASVRSRDAFAALDSGFVLISGPILVADADSFGASEAVGPISASLGSAESFAVAELLTLAAGVASVDLAGWSELEIHPSVFVTAFDSFGVVELLGPLSASVADGEPIDLIDDHRIAASTTSSDAFSGGDAGGASLYVAPIDMGDGDRIAFADAAAVIAKIRGGDSIALVDRGTLTALLGSGDLGTLVDFALQTTAPLGIVAMDSAGFVDASRLSAKVSASESATFAAVSRIAVGVASSDSFDADELSVVALNVSATDAFGFWDAESLQEYTGSIAYRIYANAGDGGPINYDSVLATTSDLTWTSPPLAANSDWWFAVRAYAVATALEEKNADAAVEVILDADRADVTNRPFPPTALRAVPIAAGSVRVEWTVGPSPAARKATGFHVYQGVGSVDWGTPAATQAATGGIAGSYAVVLGPLTDGTTYRFGVRAYNAASEEVNTVEAEATADATGPAAPASLTVTLTAES